MYIRIFYAFAGVKMLPRCSSMLVILLVRVQFQVTIFASLHQVASHTSCCKFDCEPPGLFSYLYSLIITHMAGDYSKHRLRPLNSARRMIIVILTIHA